MSNYRLAVQAVLGHYDFVVKESPDGKRRVMLAGVPDNIYIGDEKQAEVDSEYAKASYHAAYPNIEAAMAAMMAWIEEFTLAVTGPRPEAEKLSWLVKAPAARAYLAGTADAMQALMIEGEAAITGEVPGDLAKVIVEQEALFTQISVAIAGLRRKTKAALEAASPEHYEAILQAAMAEAQASAAALGVSV